MTLDDYIENGLRVVDNVFTDEECQFLIDYYESHYNRERGIDRVVRVTHNDPQFQSYINKILSVVEELYKWRPIVETVILGCMAAGTEMENHADSVKYNGTRHVENHTPNRTYTAVVMLDNGPGGETIFGNNEGLFKKYRKVIEQKRGRLHTHKCGALFYHSVAKTLAPRHTFVIWFKG